MKKFLFAILAVVLSIGMMGSAFAYFSDVAKSTNNVMQAGTLQFEIANAGGPYSDAVSASFNSPVGLYPGQTFETGAVYFKNTGTIDITWIFARFCNLVDTNNLAGSLILTKYSESSNGVTWYDEVFDAANAADYISFWNGRGAGIPADGNITLRDLYNVRNFGSGDMVTSLLLFDGGNLPSLPLAPGEVCAVKFTFQFDPMATNVLQGASASFEVDFIASMEAAYPNLYLVESGLGDLGP